MVKKTDRNKNSILVCIKCPKARFPGPSEQCYKFGGLICNIDDQNVEKYALCRFEYSLSTIDSSASKSLRLKE